MNRLYTVNENYFSIIDTEYKAYFLGLLYADGTNYLGKRNRFEIQILETDKEIIEKFKEDIHYTGPLHTIPERVMYNKIKNKTYICKPLIRLNISSKKICKDLEKLGMSNNKTFTLKFPTAEQVPIKFIWHFLRGYSDGDGYIRNTEWSIISTEEFCNSAANLINNDLSLKRTIRKRGSVYETHINGNLNTELLLTKLYKDSSIYLNRKYQIFTKLQEQNKIVNATVLQSRCTKRISQVNKIIIINRIKNGENIINLAKELNIHYTTLYRWEIKSNRAYVNKLK